MKDFKEFLEIDRQAMPRTVDQHVYQIRRFLKWLGRDPKLASNRDLRSFLALFKEKPTGTYKNVLSAIKVFYKDYLNRAQVVSSFRFPSNGGARVIVVPSKRNLHRFYSWLETCTRPRLAKSLMLTYATSGLRRDEALRLRLGDLDREKRMLVPHLQRKSRTKITWVTFYNHECEADLDVWLEEKRGQDPSDFVFGVTECFFRKRCIRFERETGVKISPQLLRDWFCVEMGLLGVPDRYVDAFCGRVPKSVLARHYTDYSPEKLKEIYDKAGLRVLS